MEGGRFRPRLAAGVCVLLVCFSFTTSLPWPRGIWVAVRWSLGGGVASTRSEGDCERQTGVRRTAQATPYIRVLRHPQRADWAGLERQSKSAAPSGAVEDGRRSMASKKNLVAAVGGRGSKELDKKPIGLEWRVEGSGRVWRPGFASC